MSQPNNEIPNNHAMINEFELEYEKEEEAEEDVQQAKAKQAKKNKAASKRSKAWLHPDVCVNENGLQKKSQHDIETLTLATQPLKTSKFFILAVFQYIKQSILYLLAKGGLLLCFTAVIIASGLLLLAIDGPHEKHVDEILKYFWFGLWWLTLGVASSIGLGSGLHTFVLYLGPHIALFTIKAMQCGRIDIKRGIYDTIQLKRGPSWLDTDCSEYGPPHFLTPHGVRVPLSSILPQIQTEAVLWGIGTALGELPPYFISRAAHLSGRDMSSSKADVETERSEGYLSRMKCWLLSHAQYLNFFTILFLSSVPNPLFDLAGIMCGQLGIPFWKFFTATLIGKAVIKTHIQTVFIISVCNNQLLDWIENELLLVLGVVPGLSPLLPDLLLKLHAVKDRYMAASPPLPSNIKVSKWGFSFASVWNTLVWLMLVNYFVKIVNSTAQGYFKEQTAVGG